jgi:hypothetical protein
LGVFNYSYMFDVDDFIRAASRPGATAVTVREELGLPYSRSYINRLMLRYVGKRPSQKSIKRPNLLREAVVTYMESQGLDRRYCYQCERKFIRECAIHPLKRYGATLDDFVFVCVERCCAPGDF